MTRAFFALELVRRGRSSGGSTEGTRRDYVRTVSERKSAVGNLAAQSASMFVKIVRS